MTNTNKLAAFILLDRSGSMAGPRWENAIGAINTYVNSLKKAGTEADVTVAAFDTAHDVIANSMNPRYAVLPLSEQPESVSFDTLRSAVPVKKYNPISIDETTPRGGTPLYDATAKIIDLAELNGAEKTAIIIMTDGEENQSKKYTLSTIRDRIASCQNRNWEVLFLGAEFNAETVAHSYGISSGKVINTSLNNISATMDWYAGSTTAYATRGVAVDTSAVKADLA